MTTQTDAVTTTIARRALNRTRRSRAAIIRFTVPESVRAALAGLVIGTLLVLIDPLVSATTALAAAAVGIGLSEARRRERAALVLCGSVGMMLAALAYLIVQLVRLL